MAAAFDALAGALAAIARAVEKSARTLVQASEFVRRGAVVHDHGRQASGAVRLAVTGFAAVDARQANFFGGLLISVRGTRWQAGRRVHLEVIVGLARLAVRV